MAKAELCRITGFRKTPCGSGMIDTLVARIVIGLT
jgi:hypothetical protein